MNLDGKAVLVTGTARLGGEVAAALARLGMSVCLGYRASRDAAESACGAIAHEGGRAITLQCDISDEMSVRHAMREVENAFGALHVLVNMASRYERVEAENLDARAWDAAMSADARGAWITSLAATPLMRRSGGGRIINFSDWVAASGRPRYEGFAAYHAAKKAVIGLTEALALELAPDILVNAIAPGPILAPGGMGEAERREVEKATPLGRWGGADEITKAVRFLIETDFVTGECIRVDGGRHLR